MELTTLDLAGILRVDCGGERFDYRDKVLWVTIGSFASMAMLIVIYGVYKMRPKVGPPEEMQGRVPSW